jgi:hypothetical protein
MTKATTSTSTTIVVLFMMSMEADAASWGGNSVCVEGGSMEGTTDTDSPALDETPSLRLDSRPLAEASCGEAPCGEAYCGEAPCGEATCREAPCGEATCREAPCGEASCGEAPCGEASCGEAPCGEEECAPPFLLGASKSGSSLALFCSAVARSRCLSKYWRSDGLVSCCIAFGWMAPDVG